MILFQMIIFVNDCSTWSMVQLKTHVETWITLNDFNGVSFFHLFFNNNYGLPALTTVTKCPNQVLYVWEVDFCTICAKQGLETWLSPNNDIRIYLLDMNHIWIKNAFWGLNNKKWRKWCSFVSPSLYNNTYGLPMLTMDTKCAKQLLYVWLVDLNTICAKLGLETWHPSNNDIRICLLDIAHSRTKNAFWVVNNKKWRKWCKLV
jgi:hypothetical protein